MAVDTITNGVLRTGLVKRQEAQTAFNLNQLQSEILRLGPSIETKTRDLQATGVGAAGKRTPSQHN